MIIWYDLETDGLGARPVILEAAFVLTDDQLVEQWRASWVIHCGPEVRESADPYVRDMHDTNGLWREAMESPFTVGDVEDAMVGMLAAFPDDTEFIGGGSGVASFDLPILKDQMPRLAQRLTYWSLDVGAVRRFWRRLGVPAYQPQGDPDAPQVAHRAAPDVDGAMTQWRYYERVAQAPAQLLRALVENPLPQDFVDGTAVGLNV